MTVKTLKNLIIELQKKEGLKNDDEIIVGNCVEFHNNKKDKNLISMGITQKKVNSINYTFLKLGYI